MDNTLENITTVLLVVTNDTKKGKFATECISEYLEITEKLHLENTKYIVTRIARKYTIDKRAQERETTKFNAYMEITFTNKIALFTQTE